MATACGHGSAVRSSSSHPIVQLWANATDSDLEQKLVFQALEARPHPAKPEPS